MKKKYLKAIVIFSILFALVIGVKATSYLYTASNVSYHNANLSGNNVQDALESLYHKYQNSTTTPPSGMTCTQKTNIKCKRATTLHTETCTQNISYQYCSGVGYTTGGSKGTTTVTYGNKVITEGVLTVGDAFDCDVNGDGTYNAATERFYYISDYFDTTLVEFNDKVGVFIYYSDVSNGVPSTNTTDGYAYASKNDIEAIGGSCTQSYGCNWFGPVTAVKQLPTTVQWSNINLYKDSRQILTQKNTISTDEEETPLAIFSYAGYAARLPTYQEIYSNCYDYNNSISDSKGLDNNCIFLLEKTQFVSSSIKDTLIYLETPISSFSTSVYTLYPRERSIFGAKFNTYVTNHSAAFAIRPVIEVPKTQISY